MSNLAKPVGLAPAGYCILIGVAGPDKPPVGARQTQAPERGDSPWDVGDRAVRTDSPCRDERWVFFDLGMAETRHCETCEREHPFHVVLQHRYWALQWVIGWLTDKQHWLTRETCQRGWELDP